MLRSCRYSTTLMIFSVKSLCGRSQKPSNLDKRLNISTIDTSPGTFSLAPGTQTVSQRPSNHGDKRLNISTTSTSQVHSHLPWVHIVAPGTFSVAPGILSLVRECINIPAATTCIAIADDVFKVPNVGIVAPAAGRPESVGRSATSPSIL